MWSDRQKEFYNKEFKTLANKQMEINIRNRYVNYLVRMLKTQGILEGRYEFLEVGCNEGIIMEMMQKIYPDSSFSGFDISDRHISAAKEKGLNVFVADAENIEIESKYDIIYGTAVLHHLKDMPKFLAGLKNYLKEDGIILFGPEPTHNNFIYIIWHTLRGFWEIEKGLRNMRKKDIKRVLKENYAAYRISTMGNAFAYAFKITGFIWDKFGFAKLPVINDMYITAKLSKDKK